MAVKAILTNRELKNKLTGLDLYVSDYQEIPHKIRNSFLYHVIVVTNLFYYKIKEHKQSDVVQFMVSKTFEEFEELYRKLFKRFPSVNFPALPSKLSIKNNTDERLQCMDKVMKLVALTQKLASSTMVISFLKGDAEKKLPAKQALPSESLRIEKESISQLFDDQSKVQDEKTSATSSKPTEDENLFEVDLSNRNADLDDVLSSLKIESNTTNNTPKTSVESSLFDDSNRVNEGEDDLFATPSDSRKSAFEKKYEFDGDEENDLSDVNDDLDDLLSLSKSSENKLSIKAQQQKLTLPSRPKSESVDISSLTGDEKDEKDGIFQRQKSQSLRKENPLKENDASSLDDIFSKNKPKGLFDDDEDDDLFAIGPSIKPTTFTDIGNMGNDDIMNYIQANN